MISDLVVRLRLFADKGDYYSDLGASAAARIEALEAALKKLAEWQPLENIGDEGGWEFDSYASRDEVQNIAHAALNPPPKKVKVFESAGLRGASEEAWASTARLREVLIGRVKERGDGE